MSKNDTLAAIVTKLQADIPAVEWTRSALFEHEVTAWPTGCVVGENWRARGDTGAPRIWDGTASIVVYAKHSGEANRDMHDMLDAIEASLDGAEIDGAAALNITEATIDQDDLKTGLCKVIAQFTLTI